MYLLWQILFLEYFIKLQKLLKCVYAQKEGFMTTFIRSLLHNPKGNGIARQVKRAEHEIAATKAKKAAFYTTNSAVFGGIETFGGLLLLGYVPRYVPLTDFAIASFFCAWPSFFQKGAMDGIKNAKSKCNTLKASEEYKAIVVRAKRIRAKKV